MNLQAKISGNGSDDSNQGLIENAFCYERIWAS